MAISTRTTPPFRPQIQAPARTPIGARATPGRQPIVELSGETVNHSPVCRANDSELVEHRECICSRPGPTLYSGQSAGNVYMKSGQLIALFVLGTCCIAISLVGQGCASKSEKNRAKAMDVYVKGLDAYRRGDKAAAIADLERASQLNPDLRMPHSVLGDIY